MTKLGEPLIEKSFDLLMIRGTAGLELSKNLKLTLGVFPFAASSALVTITVMLSLSISETSIPVKPFQKPAPTLTFGSNDCENLGAEALMLCAVVSTETLVLSLV